MKFKVAVTQFEVKKYSPENNLKRAELFIKKAASSKANIIVFPEYFITSSIEGKKEHIDSEHSYRIYFQNLAKKHKIDIISGSFIEKEKSKLYNVAYYNDSKGKIKARYKKINLWLSEKKYLKSGDKVQVFNTKYGKIGLIICWDLMFPEVFRKMIKKGVEVIFCPSYWCYKDAGKGINFDKNSEIKLVDSLCVSRAFENEIILIYCNAGGNKLIGHSQITVPFKGAIKKLNHRKEEMFIQEIDTSILKVSEKSYKIRNDLKKKP